MKAGTGVSLNEHFVLLFTHDDNVEQQLASALSDNGASVLVAHELEEVIQILHEHGRELDLVVLDFDHGSRGMNLLSAIHSWRAALPMVVLTGTDSEHVSAVAYAHGARSCLQKPVASAALTDLLNSVSSAPAHLAAA